MENKETIVRETHYTYDENEKLTSMTVNETITNPCGGCTCDEGDLMADELEVTAEHNLADIAIALISLGLCLVATASILKRR